MVDTFICDAVFKIQQKGIPQTLLKTVKKTKKKECVRAVVRARARACACVHVRGCKRVCVCMCFGKGGWRMGVWLCVCMCGCVWGGEQGGRSEKELKCVRPNRVERLELDAGAF